MNQSRFSVHADVRLHAVMPLVAFLGLVHLRVALAAGVLGRTGRCDDGGVHDGAHAHQQTLLVQVRVDLFKHRLRQVAGLQQAPELQQRRSVRHRLSRQVDTHEVAQRLTVVDRVFQGLVGQAVPLLQQVHAQHLGHAHRLAAHPAARRVQRLDHGDQTPPRHNAFHLCKKLFASRQLLLQSMFGTGKAALAHDRIGGSLDDFRHARRVPVFCNDQRFP